MKVIPIDEIDKFIADIDPHNPYFSIQKATLLSIKQKAISAVSIEKIDALIENIEITTLIPTKPLDITEATDMIRDYFIRALEDLKK